MPTNRQIIDDYYIASNLQDHQGMVKYLAEDILWSDRRRSLTPQPSAAPNEVISRVLKERQKAWKEYRIEIDTLIDGGNRIAAIGWKIGTYRANDTPTRIRFAHVWELCHGKIISFEEISGILLISDDPD